MHCPFCHHGDTRVIDSRVSDDGTSVRRRRECEACGARFNTFETAEVKLPTVLKHDGRREPFDAAKLRRGLEQAFHKRPVGPDTVEPLVERLLAVAPVEQNPAVAASITEQFGPLQRGHPAVAVSAYP